MGIAVHASEPLTSTPLVLLHAFPLDSRMWQPVLDLLPDDVPVVLVDAPGFGGSTSQEPGLERFALEVVGAIRELGSDEAVVAGLSMGGYAAMAIAEAAPGLLTGIGLLSTKASADPAPARTKRLEMVAAVERGEPDVALGMLEALLGETSRERRPAVVEQVRDMLRDAPTDGVIWAQRSMAARPDRHEALDALPDGLPALVLRGAEDSLMGAEDAASMAAALGADVVEIAQAGHLAALEQPEAVADALADLYRRAVA